MMKMKAKLRAQSTKNTYKEVLSNKIKKGNATDSLSEKQRRLHY